MDSSMSLSSRFGSKRSRWYLWFLLSLYHCCSHTSLVSRHCARGISIPPCACAICFYLISDPPRVFLLLDWPLLCLSRLSTDSQRSHLSSFTMKLKDKFHSPKIKRIPSKKGKQQQHEPPAKCTEKPANKVCLQSYARNYVCILGNPSLSQLFSLFVCLFVKRLFSCLVFCAPILHCVSACVGLPAGSQSMWRLAELLQVSKPIKTWMELGRFLNATTPS